MPDFYQIPLDLPKSSPEYQRWDKLNFILRQIFDRIGNVDGRQSEMSFKNQLDMGGNMIVNGPLMTSALDSDFVTKSWFKTAEFGKMAVNLLQATGKTPLPITASTGTPSGGGGGGGGGAVNTTAPLAGGGTPPITISIPKATSSVNGYLSSADWTTFNAKQNALTFGNLTELTSSILTIGGGTGAVIGAGTTITVKQASGAQSGYLSSGDWTTFNGKQNALSLGNLTELTSSILTIGGGTGAVVGNVTITVTAASSGVSGYLTGADWNTFNGKMGGSGTPGNIPKFSAATTLADSIIKEASSKIGVGTSGAPGYKLEVEGQIKATSGSIIPAAVVTLTDAATIATDASLGNTFKVTLGGNRILGAPTNMVDGQRCIWLITQDGTGGRTLTLAAAFNIGSDITVDLSIDPGATDMLGAWYWASANQWIVTGFLRGY